MLWGGLRIGGSCAQLGLYLGAEIPSISCVWGVNVFSLRESACVWFGTVHVCLECYFLINRGMFLGQSIYMNWYFILIQFYIDTVTEL